MPDYQCPVLTLYHARLEETLELINTSDVDALLQQPVLSALTNPVAF